MGRAVAADAKLIPLKTLQELLEIVTEAETPDAIERGGNILESQEFLNALKIEIENSIGWIGAIYSGDVYCDGEVISTEVIGMPNVQKFSVISASKEEMGIIISAKLPLAVGVSFQDISNAIYDKEDGVYFGVKTDEAEFQDDPIVRFYISLDLQNDTIADFEIITNDVLVSEPYDEYF